MILKSKKVIFILFVFIISFLLFNSCTILERIFNFGGNSQDNNGSGSDIGLTIYFNTSEVGDVKVGIAQDGGINSTWIPGFAPTYVQYYDGNTSTNLYHDFYDVPDGNYFIKAFIDTNNNGEVDYGEPYGEIEIYIDSYTMSQYQAEITITKEIIRNFNFAQSGWADSFGPYSSSTELSNYLNNVNGDYLPEWTYSIDTYTADYKQPEFVYNTSDNSITMKTNNYDPNGSNMGMEQDNVNYTVNSNSKFEIRFKIDNFDGGEFTAPYFEAPLKILLKINGTWYMARGYTTSATYDSTYGEGTLSTGIWYVRDVNLSGLQLITDDSNQFTYTIYEGDTIEAVRIKSNGWDWNVTIDYFDIFEQ